MTSTVDRALLTSRPIAAVSGVVCKEGKVLLIHRRNAPNAGRWGLPGGKMEFGESILTAIEREIREETAVQVKAKRVLTAHDVYDWTVTGTLRQHYVLIVVACQWEHGEPSAGDDALDARWFALHQLPHSELATAIDIPKLVVLASQCGSESL